MCLLIKMLSVMHLAPPSNDLRECLLWVLRQLRVSLQGLLEIIGRAPLSGEQRRELDAVCITLDHVAPLLQAAPDPEPLQAIAHALRGAVMRAIVYCNATV